MRTITLLIILISSSCLQDVHAQINNSFLEDSVTGKDSLGESLGLSIYSNTFFKNNEYFDDIAQGYTLFGTQLKSQLYYQVNKNVRIQAGMYARKDFGHDALDHIAPLFTVMFSKNKSTVLMGNLEGNCSHQLAEPLYDYERIILHPLENGLQYKFDGKKYWADTWINWEVQQYLHSTYQEQFSAGHSSKITWYKNARGFSVLMPLQGLISHKGGQLDVDTTPLKTLLNVGSGIVLQYKNPTPHAFIKSMSLDYYYTLFKDLSSTHRMSFENGKGSYINLNVQSKYDVSANVAYWSGYHYLSSRGAYLFESEASIYGKSGYIEAKRELLFFKLLYQHKLFNALNIDLRFEPYYDLPNKYFAYSYSLYLVYRNHFNFVNLTNGKRSMK